MYVPYTNRDTGTAAAFAVTIVPIAANLAISRRCGIAELIVLQPARSDAQVPKQPLCENGKAGSNLKESHTQKAPE